MEKHDNVIHSKKSWLYLALNKVDRSLAAFARQGRIDGFNLSELGILIFIGAVFYGYFLSTLSLLIDNDAAALRQDPSVWVGQGRWFTYLVEKFLLQQPSVPFAPYVILIIAFAASYMALIRAHGYIGSWKTYIIYPVFCAFPTWWAIATFYSNIPALAIGLFLISLSAYVYFGAGFTGNLAIHNSYTRIIFVILMLACAIAAYQSLILMFAAYACGILLARCLRIGGLCRISRKSLAMTLGKTILLITIAIIFYEIINKLTQKLFDSDSSYIAKAFFNYDKTITHPFLVLSAILKEQMAIYGGSAKRYGATLAINGLVIGLATIVILRTHWFKAPVNFILWLGVLLSPFIFHLVTGGEPLPMRTLIPIAYVSWLSCMILLSGKRPIAILASIILVGLLQIKIMGVTSQYIASATIVQSHDRIMIADIYSRIGGLTDNFDPDAPLKMDLYGRKGFNTLYANAWQGTMQGSFFSWDEDLLYRVTNLMNILGYKNIVIPSNAERKALNPVFDNMSVWPAAGSVKKAGDIYLIKLSKVPDPVHAL
ncbi:glucosyltransferase domain-containing protein [Sodalis sp. dw_96]|uniref:glucosyltransferase domain-containing protein n=1 Tax=Sodalis sp. dw_96 TaxID=2719794 RepID=UPI001BD6355E|nr:glucosyltransferase domain-containing protein [Sodalis sp. dw_96]